MSPGCLTPDSYGRFCSPSLVREYAWDQGKERAFWGCPRDQLVAVQYRYWLMEGCRLGLPQVEGESTVKISVLWKLVIIGNREVGAMYAECYRLNQGPRTTHPMQKHRPKLQQSLLIPDGPHWASSDPQSVILDCGSESGSQSSLTVRNCCCCC